MKPTVLEHLQNPSSTVQCRVWGPFGTARVLPITLARVTVVVDMRRSFWDPDWVRAVFAALPRSFIVQQQGILRLVFQTLSPEERIAWEEMPLAVQPWALELVGQNEGSLCRGNAWLLRSSPYEYQ